ncbi:MAG: O-antigen ligase family protein [Hyphomicrobiaceae bacterium]
MLQFLAVPALVLASWVWLDRLIVRRRNGWARDSGVADLALAAAMASCGLVIILAQVSPLYGNLGWGGVSSRIAAAGGIGLKDLSSMGSSSIDRASSLPAVAGVIPPLALFLLVSSLGIERLLRLIGWFVVFGLVCLALGILQVLQGTDSSVRFFAISNRTEAIGFFANRNHFAAQLYATLLLTVAWTATHATRPIAPRSPTSRKFLWTAGLCCVVLLLLSGLALARSRAGILFVLLAAAAIVAMSPTLVVAIGRRSRRVSRIFFVAVASVLLLVGQLGADRFLQRFDTGLVDRMRATLNATTYEALREALPFGTGLGSFPSVYAVYEKSQNLRPEYANRAHDDWLEFPLEAGVPGMLLIVLFLIWFSWALCRIWMRPSTNQDVRLCIAQQCASLVVLFLLLHSVVDYPLRTSTMLAYFSACCGLMVSRPNTSRLAGRRRHVAPGQFSTDPQFARGFQ